MKPNKTLAILPLAFGAVLTANMASAQAMSFDGIDQNGDRVLEMAEIEAAFGANAAVALQMYDTDGDGMVQKREAANVQASAGTTADMKKTGDAMMDSAKTALDDTADTVEDAGETVAEATSDMLEGTTVEGSAEVGGSVMSN